MRQIAALLLLTSCGGVAVADVTTTSTTSTTVQVAPPPTLATTTTSTTTTTLPATPCAEWYPIAIEAGWEPTVWPTLSYLIERESSCNPDAYNGSDPNGGSASLMQVNGVWLDWFLPSQNIAHTMDDLFDPLTNLRAARAIYIRQNRTFAAWGL